MAGQIPLNRRRTDTSGADYFPTPPWATRALCLRLAQQFPLKRQTVHDPACGGGYMARPLAESFKSVRASDLYDYSAEFPHEVGVDFLLDWPGDDFRADWIITNPPFALRAAEFLELMINRCRVGAAIFVKQQFLEGNGRFRRFYERRPPAAVFQFVERVPLVAGRVDPDADTNQAYIWMVWVKDPDARRAFRDLVSGSGAAFGWIAPARTKLERPGDYPAPEPNLAPAPLLDLVSK